MSAVVHGQVVLLRARCDELKMIALAELFQVLYRDGEGTPCQSLGLNRRGSPWQTGSCWEEVTLNRELQV